MATDIPSVSEVRERLQRLSWSQLQDVCKRTGAPFTTVWKIRCGETQNPGIETIRLIWPDLLAPASTQEAA